MANLISQGVDKVEELMGHSPHPAIVALPIGAWAFSNFCDGLAMLTDEAKYDDAARLSMAVGLAGASIAVVTGLNDYSKIPTERPSHDVATTHALGNAVVGTLFGISYIMRLNAQARGGRASLSARLLAMAGGGLMLYTGWLGGKLVAEMGEGVYPAMEDMQQQEDEEGRNEDHGRERLHADAPLGKQDE